MTLGGEHELVMSFDGEMWHADNEWIGVYGYGSTPEKSIDDAINEIEYLRNYYAKLGDDELIGHGLELKRRFAQLTGLK